MKGIINAITIGEFTLFKYSDGSYWIQHESLEGGEFSAEKVEKMIADFYKENF